MEFDTNVLSTPNLFKQTRPTIYNTHNKDHHCGLFFIWMTLVIVLAARRCCLSFDVFYLMLLSSVSFFKRLNAFILKSSYVVNTLLLNISTLSTAQISHLSNYTNIIKEGRKGEKTLVKLTETYNNKFAESLPSEVESQAATTAAVVAVVDCNYESKTYQKKFTGCDVVSECGYNCLLYIAGSIQFMRECVHK